MPPIFLTNPGVIQREKKLPGDHSGNHAVLRTVVILAPLGCYAPATAYSHGSALRAARAYSLGSALRAARAYSHGSALRAARAYSHGSALRAATAYSLGSGATHQPELTSFAWSLRESWVLDCFTAFAMTTAGKPTGWGWLIFPSRGGVPAGRGGCCFVVLVQSPPRAMNHHGQA